MLNHELYEQLSEEYNASLFDYDWDNSDPESAKDLFNELLNLEAHLLKNELAEKEVIYGATL